MWAILFWIFADVLRDLVLFVQHEKRENTHGGVLLLEMFQPKSLQL